MKTQNFTAESGLNNNQRDDQMKENTKRYSLAFLITLISLLVLVTSASAIELSTTKLVNTGALQPISPITPIQKIFPYVSFTYWPSDIWVGDTVHFTDTSYSYYSIASRSWDYERDYGTFIDHVHISNTQNPTYPFWSPGVYKVTLTVQNLFGFSSTSTQSITIHSYEISSPYYKQPS